jgi:hypothetical protein
VPLARSLFFGILICPSICTLQDVSARRLLGLFPCLHLSVALHSPGRECPLLAGFLSVSSLFHRSAFSRRCVSLARFPSMSSLVRRSSLSRRWVPVACGLSFHVLTYLSICALQMVSSPHSLASASCPHLSFSLRSPVGECPSLARFLSFHVFTYLWLCTTGGQYPYLACFLFMPSLVHLSTLSSG